MVEAILAEGSRVNEVELNENIYERGLLSLGPSKVQTGRPAKRKGAAEGR